MAVRSTVFPLTIVKTRWLHDVRLAVALAPVVPHCVVDLASPGGKRIRVGSPCFVLARNCTPFPGRHTRGVNGVRPRPAAGVSRPVGAGYIRPLDVARARRADPRAALAAVTSARGSQPLGSPEYLAVRSRGQARARLSRDRWIRPAAADEESEKQHSGPCQAPPSAAGAGARRRAAPRRYFPVGPALP